MARIAPGLDDAVRRLEQLELDVELLDRRLDDDVAAADPRAGSFRRSGQDGVLVGAPSSLSTRAAVLRDRVRPLPDERVREIAHDDRDAGERSHVRDAVPHLPGTDDAQGRDLHQILRIAIPTALPRPGTAPRSLLSLRSSSACRSVVRILARRLRSDGRARPRRPHVVLGAIQAETLRGRDLLDGDERFVELVQVDASGVSPSSPRASAPPSRSHHREARAPDRTTRTPRSRLAASRPRRFAVASGDDEGRGSVVHAGGVPAVTVPSFLKAGFKRAALRVVARAAIRRCRIAQGRPSCPGCRRRRSRA